MKRFCAVFALIFFSSFCQAGLSIEPFIGVGGFLSNSKLYYVAPSIGSRLGYSRWGLMMGVDAGYTGYSPFFRSYEVDQSVNPFQAGVSQVFPSAAKITSNAASYDVYYIGPSVSFGLPLFLDAYASLVWSWADSYMNISSDQASLTLLGPGLKVGVSYLSLPFLSINLEFQALTFVSCVDSSKEKLCKDYFKKQKGLSETIFIGLLNLSVPISTGFL